MKKIGWTLQNLFQIEILESAWRDGILHSIKVTTEQDGLKKKMRF